MKSNTLLILGGYGNTGRMIANLLLQETTVHLILAGRDLKKAELATKALNAQFPGERVAASAADAANRADLLPLFSKVRMVVVASSTAKHTANIAEVALNVGIDYMDIHFGPKVYTQLYAMDAQIMDKGKSFISGGGFHPGLPAAMIRFAGQYFDEMETAIVSGVMNVDFSTYEYTPNTRREFVEELADFNPLFYKNGHWQKMNMLSTRDMLKVDFGEYGEKICSPLFFEELQELPTTFSRLKHVGFYIAGFNPVVDYFIFPLVIFLQKILPKSAIEPLSRLMLWGMKKFAKPPYGYMIKLEATGKKAGKQENLSLNLSHTDPAFITAAPVVACLLQYLETKNLRPGLWLQAWYVEPNRFMQDIQRMGLICETNKIIEMG